MDQFSFAFGNELIVDLFAGGGGASLGIEQAFHRPVDIAVNHNPDAIGMHAANHPATMHHISDVFEVDPLAATGGRQVGLLWASPDCKHFSRAKGGVPRSKKIRALAWVVVKWAEKVRPRVIALENVCEFLEWGPLGSDGQPCPRRKGETFKRWLAQLRRLGYVVEWRELRACDYGAPTIRNRFFLVARCDGQPIVWPTPTHGNPKSSDVRRGKLLPWRTAADCIDWGLPAHSIFLSAKEGKARGLKRPLAEATLNRIAKGMDRFVLSSAEPFIVNTRNGERAGQDARVRSIHEPGWTVTAHGSQGALCVPLLVDVAHAERGKNGSTRWGKGEHAVTEPMKTLTTSRTQALAIGFLTKYHGDNAGASAAHPFPTITANGDSDRPGGNPPLAVVVAYMEQANTGLVGHDMRSPVSTIVGKGCTQRLVEATLVHESMFCEERAELARIFLEERLGPGSNIVTIDGNRYLIADIGLRMLTPRELFRAQGFPEDYVIDFGANGRALPKDAQVRACGNSVCPPVARAVVEANVGRLVQTERTLRIA